MLVQKWTHKFDGPHVGEPDESCTVCKSQIAAASMEPLCNEPGYGRQAQRLNGLMSPFSQSLEHTEGNNQSRQQEIVIKHDRAPKPGWPCPSCHGMGDMGNGSMSISQEETRYTPPTPCYLCKGKGRVLVTAIPD